MAWIESHDTLGEHPKVYELCTALNADKATSIGVLHLLWHFTLKFSWRNGDLSKFSKDAICSAIGWKGDAVTLFDALHKCGWLQEMRVHDWLDYAGKIVNDRLYNEKRKRRKTTKNGVSFRKMTATLPYPTQPNLTLPKDPPNPPRGGMAGFESFWKEYPKKVGKGAAEKSWIKIKPLNGLVEKMIQALILQKRSEQWVKDDGQYIPNPATWLNQRRWEDEPGIGASRSISKFQRLNELST